MGSLTLPTDKQSIGIHHNCVSQKYAYPDSRVAAPAPLSPFNSVAGWQQCGGRSRPPTSYPSGHRTILSFLWMLGDMGLFHDRPTSFIEITWSGASAVGVDR